MLILDDALRPQAIIAGVPAVICTAIKQWENEILCLRELLGALQTLCWDKECLKGVLQNDIVSYLIEFVQVIFIVKKMCIFKIICLKLLYFRLLIKKYQH